MRVWWNKLTAEVQNSLPPDILTYSQDGPGYRPLREAVAGYVKAARAVACEPEQVIITLGAHQALYLCAQTLTNGGDLAWVEEPGYMGAKGSLWCQGVDTVPVPVDEEGLNVDAGVEMAPDARLAIVTPSHQYPLGYTLSLARRFQLLQWASQAGSWIIEDDYDSEFRYSGPPLEALQGLDTNGRVIYVGTFSKVMFPVIWLPEGIDEKALAARIGPFAGGAPIRYTYINRPARPGFVLSFSATDEEQIRRDVGKLSRAVNELGRHG